MVERIAAFRTGNGSRLAPGARLSPWTFAFSVLLCVASVSSGTALPPVFPAEGTGWDITYATLATEDFSTPNRTVGPMSEIGEIGSLATSSPLRGKASLAAASDGSRAYRHYFNTRPDLLPLKAGGTYRLTFTYRIIEAGDKGFEAIFYSPAAGEAGRWLEGLTIKGPTGTSGVATLERTLYDYGDYRAWLSVVGRGSIVVDDIKLAENGKTIFEEDFERVLPGPGQGVRSIGARMEPDGRIMLESGARLETDPSFIALPGLSELRISFDYWIVAPTVDSRNLDLRLIPGPDAGSTVSLRPLLRNAPVVGRFSAGFGTGSAGPYRVSIMAGRGARVLVDNILVEKGVPRTFTVEPASYAYLEQAPFPRLGNYIQLSPVEQVEHGGFEAKAWRSTVEKEEERLALFDVIFGFIPTREHFDHGFPRRIRERNPYAVLLPYVIGQETMPLTHKRRVESPDPDGEPGFRFDIGVAREWFVKDTKGVLVNDLDYPGILKFDISPGALRAGGKTFLEYQIESFRREFFGSGIWDGLFIDNLFARMNGHIPNAWYPERLDYDINRDGTRDETPALLNRISYDAERVLLEGLIAGTGNRELLMGNNGPLPETRLAPYVNGYVFENFNIAWEGGGNAWRFSEPGWRRALDDYRVMDERCRAPRINAIEAWGRVESFAVPTKGRADRTPEDVARNRFALGTALLGDAFYEYDLTDARSSIAWFDEFAVDEDGVARESASGKGYLGKALGPAVELALPARLLWEEDFEGSKAKARGGGEGSSLSGKAAELLSGARSVVIEGKKRRSDSMPFYETAGAPTRMRKGTTYLVEFSWKVLEDLDYGLWFAIGSGKDGSYTPINALYSGETGRCRYPFTPLEDGDYVLRFWILSAGKVAIDDIKVFEGGVGPWRRDFENGFVLVNPYRVSASFDKAALAGAMGRTGIRRIKGSQAPEVNTGERVAGGLELGPFDAIILLADRRLAR